MENAGTDTSRALRTLSATSSRVDAAGPEQADVDIADWDAMFTAVVARLRSIVTTAPARLMATPAQGGAARVHDSVLDGVLDCAGALEKLHATLVHEVGRRRRLELEIFDARAALALRRGGDASAQPWPRRPAARIDALTTLPNRSAFQQWLDHALAEAEPRRSTVAVLTLGLDDVRPIAAAHGRRIGDQVLSIVASRLSRAVRAEDMVSRLDEHTFACLRCNAGDRERLDQLGAKLHATAAAPLAFGELELRLQPAVGIATAPADGADAQVLLAHASAAMLRARRRQRGRAFYDEGAAD